MKRARMLLPALCLLLLFSACRAQREYLVITPHEGQYVKEENEGAIVVGSYDALTSALMYLVTNRETSGLIRASNYSGSVSEDVAEAVYTVAKRTPLGSYAVDYITYDVIQVVSYSDVTVNISYTKSREELQKIVSVRNSAAVLTRLASAMEHYEPSLCLYVYGYETQDLAAYVRSYYEEHPGTLQGLPELQASFFPTEQSECILALSLRYPEETAEMLRRQAAVQAEAASAAEYVQYRETQTEQLELLYSYLSERFDYEARTTATPVYAALCEGVASSAGFARAMKVICDALEIECCVVQGMYNGSDWWWNIVKLDGQYYHIDVMRDVLAEADSLGMNLDAAMGAYHWEAADYPACAIRPDDWPELGTEAEIGENIPAGP